MKISDLPISIIGLGYVGLPLAVQIASKGYSVVGLDIDLDKIGKLNEGIIPFIDDELQNNFDRVQNLKFTSDYSVVSNSDFIVVCVPTPVHDNLQPNLKPLESSVSSLSKHLREGQIIIIESTINPGVCEEILIPLIESISGFKVGVDVHIAHCPERINPGDKLWNVSNINRVVGSTSEIGLERAYQFYDAVIDAKIMKMLSIKEAEAVKIVENSFRDINIAFVNELARSFDRLGIDVVNVINGAATKPFAFLAHYPGCGVGGHCIPVDPYYLIEYAKERGFHHEFLSLGRKINREMPDYTVQLLVEGLNEIQKSVKGTKIALLGVSYKRDIDDYRESPSFDILKRIQELSGDIVIFDPFVPQISTVSSLDEALEGVVAIVIATDHSMFKNTLNSVYLESKGVKLVIDGRNCLNKLDFGRPPGKIIYEGIGRR